MDDSTARKRERMVAEQIAARGIATPPCSRRCARCRASSSSTRRCARRRLRRHTVADRAHGQTISQPYIVALMLAAAAVQPSDRVLEIGVGSGYASALAGLIVAHVDAVERHPRLVESARERLARLGDINVDVHERRRQRRLAGGRAVRRDHGRRRRAARPGSAARISSTPADAW